MKNCAVVCEYNPFHSGHKYQLDRIREFGAQNIICVMSGAFVQSGLPAFCDRSIRAECAVMGGADAVIELPTYFATSSAQGFAEGGVRIISAIDGITHIAMGATAAADVILRLADIKSENSAEYTSALKSGLALGKSYSGACAAALAALYEKKYGDGNAAAQAIAEPNNMLCVEYIAAARALNADITPLIIPRIGARHTESGEIDGYVSATTIRNADLASMKAYIPYRFDAIAADVLDRGADMATFSKLALFTIKTCELQSLARLRGCSEGMEFLLKKCAESASNLGELVRSVSGVRYPVKRIFRLICDLLLQIDKYIRCDKFVTRLLACKTNFDFSVLPEFVKTNNEDIKAAAADADVKAMLQIDERAVALYNTLCGKHGGYYNYSLVKV